jgi:hypothetical protein
MLHNIFVLYNLLFHLSTISTNIHRIMQSDDGSQSPSQESGVSPSPVPPMVEAFYITREDAKILEEYIEQFEEGDNDLRTTIVANAMAELSGLCPETEPFDKIEASKVSGHTI